MLLAHRCKITAGENGALGMWETGGQLNQGEQRRKRNPRRKLVLIALFSFLENAQEGLSAHWLSPAWSFPGFTYQQEEPRGH